MADKYIVVNSTAAVSGGALTILRQFIDHIPQDGNKWLVFTSDKVSLTSDNPNVRIVPIAGTAAMHKRLMWDAFGLDKWLKDNNIEPTACISLQNTGFRVSRKGIPHFIYYHQSLPFYAQNWNPLKASERTFAFYKYVYPFFVKLFLKKDTNVIVQANYLKKCFSKRYNHSTECIGVFNPDIKLPELPEGCKNTDHSDTIKLFYPAAYLKYKNHNVLFKALKDMKGVELIATVDPKLSTDNIKCVGKIPYEKVMEYYAKSDALVFPSYIETFGLPLLEAALCGLPVIAVDLPYAHEILQGYSGAHFAPVNDHEAWRKEISALKPGQCLEPICLEGRPGWKELFSHIISKINRSQN